MKKEKITPDSLITLFKEIGDSDEFINIIQERGFSFIGGGVYRNVYRSPDGKFVVKIGDEYHNEMEVENLEILPESHVPKLLAFNSNYPNILVEEYIDGEECPYKTWQECYGKLPASLKKISDFHSANHLHVKKKGKDHIILVDLGGDAYPDEEEE